MKRTYLFGILPAIIGILIFILWYVTKHEFFILSGMLFLYVGLASISVGIISSFIQLIKHKEIKTFFIGLSINLINLPIAFFLASTAISIITAYTIQFENKSSFQISNILLNGPSVKASVKSLEIGQLTKSSLHFKGDGKLTLTYVNNGISTTKTIEGYVTGGMGGHSKVVFYNTGANILHNASVL